jgi:hypothetical protein
MEIEGTIPLVTRDGLAGAVLHIPRSADPVVLQ